MVRLTDRPDMILDGVAKVRKEGSFRERKVPFAKGRFIYERKIFFTFLCPFIVN